jgi:tetratricopeptide (TPR) repeat protein
MVRTAIYKNLSPIKRRCLHRQVAQVLETAGDEFLIYEDLDYQIASHYERAGIPFKAISFYRQAGDRALEVYATSQAISYFRNALSCMPDPLPYGSLGQSLEKECIHLLQTLGENLELTGEHELAREHLLKAKKELLQYPQDRVIAACNQRLIGDTYKSEGNYRFASQAYELAKSYLDAESIETDPEVRNEWLGLQISRAFMYYGSGDAASMLELAIEMEPVIKSHGNKVQRGQFYLIKSVMQSRRDRYKVDGESLSLIKEALRDFEEVGDLYWISEAQFVFGLSSLLMDEFTQAESYLLSALENLKRMDKEFLYIICLGYLSLLFRRINKKETCLEYAKRCLSLAESADMNTYAGLAKANLGWLSWKSNDSISVKEYCRSAVDLWKGSVYPFQWTARLPLIAVMLSEDLHVEALQQAQTMLANTQQVLPPKLNKLIEDGIMWWKKNDQVGSLQSLRKARNIAEEIHYL